MVELRIRNIRTILLLIPILIRIRIGIVDEFQLNFVQISAMNLWLVCSSAWIQVDKLSISSAWRYGILDIKHDCSETCGSIMFMKLLAVSICRRFCH